jgi:hypothetical protein
LHWRFDIAKKDAADAESGLSMAMDTVNKLTREKDEWKRTQLQMATDMEKLSHNNRRLRIAEGQHDVEVQMLWAAKEKEEHAMAALQAELATIKLECQVAVSTVKKYKGSMAVIDMENQRLVRELEKGQSLAHANVKRLLQRIREATMAEIQARKANALKECCEQAAELQLLRADKANQELRGPGVWKLDKTNCETA